jgi:hypothetical protein
MATIGCEKLTERWGARGTFPSGAKRVTSRAPPTFGATRVVGLGGKECFTVLPVRGGGRERSRKAKSVLSPFLVRSLGSRPSRTFTCAGASSCAAAIVCLITRAPALFPSLSKIVSPGLASSSCSRTLSSSVSTCATPVLPGWLALRLPRQLRLALTRTRERRNANFFELGSCIVFTRGRRRRLGVPTYIRTKGLEDLCRVPAGEGKDTPKSPVVSGS